MITVPRNVAPSVDAVLHRFEFEAGFSSDEFARRDAAGEFDGHTWALAWRMVLASATP